jgi:hypothetical protein
MVSRLPGPQHRLAVLLGSALALVVGVVPAHAEQLVAQISSDSARRGQGYQPGGSSRIVYRSGRPEDEMEEAAVAGDPRAVGAVLAMILVAPAGIQPMSSSSSSTSSSSSSNLSSVTKAASGSSKGTTGQTSAGATDPASAVSAPEPASLGLALLGTALTGWVRLQRRRLAAGPSC